MLIHTQRLWLNANNYLACCRFTLKLRWLMNGTFDTEFGEYEWIHRRKEMDNNRRKFNL
jgi:hypothetical protein